MDEAEGSNDSIQCDQYLCQTHRNELTNGHNNIDNTEIEKQDNQMNQVKIEAEQKDNA